jgi:hypothetical protein
VIKTLQKLNFTHDILDLVVVHPIQADSLDRYSLPSRVVEGFVDGAELTLTNTFTQRLESVSYTKKMNLHIGRHHPWLVYPA